MAEKITAAMKNSTYEGVRIRPGEAARQYREHVERILKLKKATPEDLWRAVWEDNKLLRMALEPFARKTDAHTLADALGHITREDLELASTTMAKTGGKPR